MEKLSAWRCCPLYGIVPSMMDSLVRDTGFRTLLLPLRLGYEGFLMK
jgi:hypothetical protein